MQCTQRASGAPIHLCSWLRSPSLDLQDRRRAAVRQARPGPPAPDPTLAGWLLQSDATVSPTNAPSTRASYRHGFCAAHSAAFHSRQQPIGKAITCALIVLHLLRSIAEMAKIKTTARKSGGGTASRVNASRRVWHPALTTAAELGEEHLEAALEAEVEEEDGIVYEVHPMACVPHSRFSLPADAGEPSGPASPFPLDSCFGIIAYATWHGHHEVVKAYLDELEADANGAAVVSCMSCQHAVQTRGAKMAVHTNVQRQAAGSCAAAPPA